VELRVLAHVAQEELLIDAFQHDLDIHAVTAAKLFGVPVEAVDRSQRGLGKTINFATIYGSSAFGISSRTDLTHEQARQFLDQYFKTYPRIRAYIDETIAGASSNGYVHRRCWVVNASSGNCSRATLPIQPEAGAVERVRRSTRRSRGPPPTS
jgi:DNA polymerase-1